MVEQCRKIKDNNRESQVRVNLGGKFAKVKLQTEMRYHNGHAHLTRQQCLRGTGQLSAAVLHVRI